MTDYQPIDAIHSYYSKPFDIIVEREGPSAFDRFTIAVIKDNRILEVRTYVHRNCIDEVREELKMKYLCN